MTFAQRWNCLTTHFLERIPIIKWRKTVLTCYVMVLVWNTISIVWMTFDVLLLRHQGPEHLPRMQCSLKAYCVTLFPTYVLDVSNFHRQMPLHPHDTRDPRSKRWNLMGENSNRRLQRYISASFTCCKSTTWDWQLYFPSKGRCAEDFSPLKILMASAGFEPANLGTQRQRATPRPPKPLSLLLHWCVSVKCAWSYVSALAGECGMNLRSFVSMLQGNME